MLKNIKIVFSDFDATLLNSSKQVSDSDISCLIELGEKKIVRVLATGRSYFSIKKVIGSKFPVDFIIFSSGAGIIDCSSGKLIYSENHKYHDIVLISKILIDSRVDFMIHESVPENHKFTYYKSNKNNSDFKRRIQLYGVHATAFQTFDKIPKISAQIIGILSDIYEFNTLSQSLDKYSIIRTTSPLDKTTVWMEIFPKYVSKGHGAEWLCEYLKISMDHSISIGNDYNDIALLEATARSYVVGNAPADLQKRYNNTKSCDDSGFSYLLSKMIPELN